MFFAYDTPDDYEPLIAAGRLLRSEGVTQTSHRAACYVLIGYPGDTMDAAEKRLLDTYRAGFGPLRCFTGTPAGSRRNSGTSSSGCGYAPSQFIIASKQSSRTVLPSCRCRNIFAERG